MSLALKTGVARVKRGIQGTITAEVTSLRAANAAIGLALALDGAHLHADKETTTTIVVRAKRLRNKQKPDFER